jgi:transposase
MATGLEEDHYGGMKRAAKANKKALPTATESRKRFTVEDLWAEVQELRAALEASERRAASLEKRVRELEAENEALRKKRWATEELLQKKIRTLEKDVSNRDKKIEKLQKQVSWLRTQKFGRTSEKDGPEATEATAEDVGNGKQPKKGKKKRGQQPGSDGHGRTDRSGLPISETIPLEIAGGCACAKCGKAYVQLPATEDSALAEIAIMLHQVVYQRFKYVSQCKCEGKKIVVAPPPARLYPRTNVGNSLWVYLLVQKFLHAVPTNRTLKDLSLYGFSLAEGTVSGGFKMIDDLLETLLDEILKRCKAADLWNADETTWHILDAGKTKWWMWLIASDDAIAYLLDPSRSKKVPANFFAGSAGVLMTDRLAAYKSLQDAIKKAWCWVHVRRDFRNLLIGVPKLKQWAKQWLKEIATLFVVAHQRFQLWEQNKTLGAVWQHAQLAVEQQVEKLKLRWQAELSKQDLHDEQKKVLRSLKRHWDGLTLFVEDPRIPLHNNRAERLLRNAVILRKNSFGSGTSWAGHLAAKLFSIFQTWLVNGLDPQALLLDYFNECAKTPGRAPPDVSQFLPWKMSDERKQCFALPASYKRPG